MANVDQIAQTIKIRESGGNYTDPPNGPKATASGAYQYINSTWKAEATKAGVDWQGNGWTSAYMAPASVQDQVAKNNIQNILNANNGNIEAVPNVWYTGNAAGNMTASQLAANGGQTSQQYTQKWLTDYAKVTGGTYTTTADGAGVVVDKNGKVTATVNDVPGIASSGFAVYTGAEQVQIIKSMQDLEQLESNWEENILDQSDDYIYNLELFLVDRADLVDFMQTAPNIIENDGWPRAGQKKVVIAKTGETSEFVITDLVVDSLSVGGSTSENQIVSNSATQLSFSITRVGNARLGDAIQDAIAVAGYQSIPTANFFIKIKFTRIDENGNASTIPNTTKVLPFRIKNIKDLSTSTDNKGTTATLEGNIMRKYAVETPGICQLKYKTTSEVDRNNADTTIENFITALNNLIKEKSYSNNENYDITYKYVRDRHFKEKYATLVLGDPNGFRTGPGGGDAAVAANAQNNTIAIANNTLEVQPTTNIIDVIKDILINTNEMKQHLTSPRDTHSDLFSIEVDYVPKDNGYNILTQTEGATVTFTISLKEEIIEHNTRNQIALLSNINQLMENIVGTGRLKKKYYYYYTGKNDQIMQFDISLNKQLIKVENEEFDVFYDVNQVNSLDDMIVNTKFYSDMTLKSLVEDFNRAKQSVSATEAALNNAKSKYATQVQDIKNDFISSIIANGAVGPQSLDAFISSFNNRFSNMDMYALTDDGNQTMLEVEFARVEEEFGFTDGTVLTEEVKASLASLRTEINKAKDEFNNAKARLSEMETSVANRVNDIAGTTLSDRAYEIGLGDTQSTFTSLGITSNIATLEDLGTDLRRKITTTEVVGLLNLLATSSARFISTAVQIINDPSTNVRLLMPNDQKKLQLAFAKYSEGWQQDTSMYEATMKIKGDPYWLQNYSSAEMRNSVYGRSNYRPNNVSTTVGANHIMVINNTVDGVDQADQPTVSNLFRYIYIIRSIRSEFSNGLFTQTLDMRRLTLAETYSTNPLTAESSINSDSSGADTGLTERPSQGVHAGESITLSDTASNGTTENTPTGDLQVIISQYIAAKNRSDELFFGRNSSTPRTMTPQEEAEYDALQIKISDIYNRFPNINQLIADSINQPNGGPR